MLGGALNPPDGVMLLFRGDSPAAAEAFAKADPYVLNGIVTGWRVREWTTVVGPDAEVKLPASSDVRLKAAPTERKSGCQGGPYRRIR